METALEYMQRRFAEDNWELKNPHWSTVDMEYVLKEIVRPAPLNWDTEPMLCALRGENSEEQFEVMIKKKRAGDRYDYFTKAALVCDGTLVFWLTLFTEIVQKLINGNTYYTLAFKEISPFGYRFIYEVDEAVMLSQCDESFAPEDKPWMCASFQLYLPIKFSVERLGEQHGKE